MFDGEIKVSKYIKKIKVNENGEYLEINLNDSGLLENYTNMAYEIKTCTESEISNKDIDVNNDNLEAMINSLKKVLSSHKKLAGIIDKYMGEGTCKKVFGIKYPTADSVFEFLIQYQALLEQYTGEKLESMESVKSNYLNKLNDRRRV
nr:MAG TPA: tail assembly chaperone protein [Bacteriophage sp.]